MINSNSDSRPHAPVPTPGTVMEALIAAHPHAHRTTLRHMFSQGRVLVNAAPARALKQTLTATDHVTIGDASARPTVLPDGLKIIHQDAEVIVVEKPPGLLTATHENETRPTALAILNRHVTRHNGKNKIFLVHRLDQHASGLLVFARGIKALNFLKNQFINHSITREYEVVVHGCPQPPQGRLASNLIEGPDRIVRLCPADRGQPAILDYRVLVPATGTVPASRLLCRLYTGRKHQIRVQFNALGHPVLGDTVYGSLKYPAKPGVAPRLALHAARLVFKHPRTGRDIEFLSPLPADILRQMSKARPAHPLFPPQTTARTKPSATTPPVAPSRQPPRRLALRRRRR